MGIKGDNMDHGKDPCLLLVKLTLMLMIGPSTETYYHSCVCVDQ